LIKKITRLFFFVTNPPNAASDKYDDVFFHHLFKMW
jgi:hypothetical protein